MAASVFVLNFVCRPRLVGGSLRGLILIPTSLAFVSCLFIFYYISSTSTLLMIHHLNDNDFRAHKPLLTHISINPKPTTSSVLDQFHSSNVSVKVVVGGGDVPVPLPIPDGSATAEETQTDHHLPSQRFLGGSNGNDANDKNVFHEEEVFEENYKEMKRSMRIFVYPHRRNDPFANVLLPAVSSEPGGNYASEGYFKKALMKSHFITKDPSEADLFFLPFSIASMRHDTRIGVGGIPDFVRNYILNISRDYPYWNRTGGADHFYVACHSIGKIAMDKAVEVRLNSIQVVCSSNYFVAGYVAHKDVSLPQIWPRQGDPPQLVLDPSKRKKLAFFAGAANSPVRKELVRVWRNDSEIFAHAGRLKTPYSTELLRSKFCLHVKGYEVNTARIGDALYYGCVPVVLADHYDLPFSDIFNWTSFSVVVATVDIPMLKRILQGIDSDEYLRLQGNVLKVRRHFQWHSSPIDYDAFHMVMYELWIRRSFVGFPTMHID